MTARQVVGVLDHHDLEGVERLPVGHAARSAFEMLMPLCAIALVIAAAIPGSSTHITSSRTGRGEYAT